MNMIERVAIALSMTDPDERGLPNGMSMPDFYRMLAKAAIEVMREPTDEMVKAGHPWAGVAGSSAKNTYTAMIDASLNEQ